MKNLKLLFCLFVLSPVLLPGTSTADENGYDSWRDRISIVGAWKIEFTVRFDGPDCATTAPVPFGVNPFPSLNTFHEGGTMSETGSRSPPSLRSPGHGIWKRSGRNKFEALYTFQGFDANGFLASNMDIRSEIQLSPDGGTFTGVSKLARSDLSGNIAMFCATVAGVRMTL